MSIWCYCHCTVLLIGKKYSEKPVISEHYDLSVNVLYIRLSWIYFIWAHAIYSTLSLHKNLFLLPLQYMTFYQKWPACSRVSLWQRYLKGPPNKEAQVSEKLMFSLLKTASLWDHTLGNWNLQHHKGIFKFGHSVNETWKEFHERQLPGALSQSIRPSWRMPHYFLWATEYQS